MRKVLATLAASCAFLATLSVVASACEYHDKQATAAAQAADQTAQAQPASTQN